VIAPWRRMRAGSFLSRIDWRGRLVTDSFNRETRPPSWSMVIIGSTAAQSAQVVAELPQLHRRLDVAAEQNETAGLEPAKDRGRADRVPGRARR